MARSKSQLFLVLFHKKCYCITIFEGLSAEASRWLKLLSREKVIQPKVVFELSLRLCSFSTLLSINF